MTSDPLHFILQLLERTLPKTQTASEWFLPNQDQKNAHVISLHTVNFNVVMILTATLLALRLFPSVTFTFVRHVISCFIFFPGFQACDVILRVTQILVRACAVELKPCLYFFFQIDVNFCTHLIQIADWLERRNMDSFRLKHSMNKQITSF